MRLNNEIIIIIIKVFWLRVGLFVCTSATTSTSTIINNQQQSTSTRRS